MTAKPVSPAVDPDAPLLEVKDLSSFQKLDKRMVKEMDKVFMSSQRQGRISFYMTS